MARSPAKPSEVMSPLATSSPSASRQPSSGRSHADRSSCANEAPRERRWSRILREAAVRPFGTSKGRALHQRRGPRRRPRAGRTTGRRDRAGTARSAWRRRPVSVRSTAAPTPTSPVRHNMSSSDGLVALEPRRQHVALPRARRQLEAIELRDHRTQAFRSRRAGSPRRRAARRTGIA